MTTAIAATAEPDGRRRGRLWRFIGYYGLSEAAQRATRIATTVLLARLLSPADLGLAATAITCFELMRVMANAGVGQAVVRAEPEELAGTCLTAHKLMWAVCSGLAVAQTVVGSLIAISTGHLDLAGMTAALAGVYLFMPPALVQTYLAQRAGRHGAIALVATVQAVVDNVLTIVLALAGAGAWAIVLPKLLAAPVWTIAMRRAAAWHRDPSARPVPVRTITRFALPVLGTELATTARLQLDKVVVGSMLGLDALGTYYFVFNAGIGLALSLTSALSNSLYPHYAAAASSARRLLALFDASLGRTVLAVATVVVAQAALAPIYVPIVFGARWSGAAVMVAILCASGAVKVYADAASQALRAAGDTHAEFAFTLAITLASLASLAVGLGVGLFAGIVALASTSATTQALFVLAARRRLLRRCQPAPAEPRVAP